MKLYYFIESIKFITYYKILKVALSFGFKKLHYYKPPMLCITTYILVNPAMNTNTYL